MLISVLYQERFEVSYYNFAWFYTAACIGFILSVKSRRIEQTYALHEVFFFAVRALYCNLTLFLGFSSHACCLHWGWFREKKITGIMQHTRWEIIVIFIKKRNGCGCCFQNKIKYLIKNEIKKLYLY